MWSRLEAKEKVRHEMPACLNLVEERWRLDKGKKSRVLTLDASNKKW